MRTCHFALLSLLGWIVPGAASAADYTQKGAIATTTSDLPASVRGGASGGKLVVPDGTGKYPLILASHGFTASSDNQVGWAEHYASWGFVVAVPDLGMLPDQAKNPPILKEIARLLLDPTTASPAQGKVDPTRFGMEGHSAGGLTTVLAAKELHPAAVVLFDPVLGGGAPGSQPNPDGRPAYASLCNPVLGIFANPSSCNNSGDWQAFKLEAPGDLVVFNMKGATHCDGENNARSLCGLTCGGAADPTRQAQFARYATAMFLARLSGDAEAEKELTTVALAANAALADVTVRAATAACATADAGGSPADAAPTTGDAGAASDANGAAAGSNPPGGGGGTAGPDAATGANGGAAGAESGTSPGSSGGCQVARAGGTAGLWLGVVVLGAALRRRKGARTP